MRIFAFDLETFLIQPGKHVPRGVCVSWAAGPFGTVSEYGLAHLNPAFGQRSHVRDILYGALTSADIVCGANVPFDLAVISQEFPELWPWVWRAYRDGRIADIETTEKLIAIGKGELKFRMVMLPDGTRVAQKRKYDLATLSRERVGIPLDKDTWRLKYGTLYDVPIDRWEPGAVEYAQLDAIVTLVAMQSQLREEPRFLVDVARQARAGWWIHLMTVHGFKVDGRAVRALEEETRRAMGSKAGLCMVYGMVKPSGAKDTKIAQARMLEVCASKGIEPKVTPTGKVKLTEEACLETGDPALIAYAEYASLSNVLKKDVVSLKAAADAGVPVQSRFDVIKATGRTGSSGGKVKKKDLANRTAYGFQLQNVRRDPKPDKDGRYPPTVRGCFVPRHGYRLCSIDYGQMELHAWAQVCLDLLGFSDLAKMLNAGIDVHCKLGSMAVGRPYEEVYANRKKENWAKDARQMSKAGNFGFPGGLGAKRFRAYAKASWGVDLTEAQAVELYALWKKMLSEADPYFEHVKRLVEEGEGEIVQVRSNRVRGDVGFTDGANGYFQALAADCAKDAGFDLAEAFYLDESSPAFGSRIVDMVHDEFIFEVPIERDHEAATAANAIMEAAGRRWMPDCPPKSEPALMERWYKDAEAVYENGRLSVWRPKALGRMELG